MLSETLVESGDKQTAVVQWHDRQHAIAISFAPFPFKVRAIYTNGPKMAKAGIIMAHMPAP